MNKPTFDAMLAQYKKPTIEGEGSVSWDKGARCVIPKVEIGGKGEQKTYSGKNLFNPESTFFIATSTHDQAYPPKYENGIFYPAGATGISNGQMICIRVKPGEVYTLSFELVSGAPTNGGIVGFAERGENGIGTGISYTLSIIPTSPWTFVIPAGVNYIGIQPLFGNNRYSVSVRDIMLVKKASNTNSPPGEYEPYTGGIPAPNPNYPIMPAFSEGTTIRATNADGFDGGTATAPELRAIPGTEYRDTWDAQTGKGVKRIGVQKFDGTEAWYAYNTTSAALVNWCGKKDIQRSYNEPSGYLCNIAQEGINGNPDANDGTFITHNQSGINWIVFHTNMLLAEWKAYLAAQYVAGIPVTVWYALAEPVEFQTEPQLLIQPKGTCNIIQTEGEISSCPISVKYLAHK